MARRNLLWQMLLVVVIFLACGGSLDSAQAGRPYNFHDLGTLKGYTNSGASGINASGQVVGSLWNSDGPGRAFLYPFPGGPMQALKGGTGSAGRGINASGQVVGQVYSGGEFGSSHAFLYAYPGGPMQDLLGGDGAAGINASGQVVGSSGMRAFLYPYPGGPMQDLGTLGHNDYTEANGINDSGQVVGYSMTADGYRHAFLYPYPGGPMQDLGTLGGGQSFAQGINASGQVVGYSETIPLADHAFLYPPGGPMQDLGTLGGWLSIAYAINASGQVVGYSSTADGTPHAFLYAYPGGPMQDLNDLVVDLPPGVSLTGASGINDQGWIVGGTDHYHAFLLTIGDFAKIVDPVWTNYQGNDGAKPVVAVQGSRTFVAYGNTAGTPGRVEMHDANGNFVGGSDLMDLNGGRVTAIAVSGSTVYVAGYAGTAGSGTEYVFAVAFKASSNGLTQLWEHPSSPNPNAGMYPIGIKALGSKIVLCYNTDSGDETSVRGKLLGLDPKTGANKWGPADYGDLNHANRVNDIAMKGSQFVAVGFQESGGSKYVNVSLFSAVNGSSILTTGQGPGGAENEALAVSWVGSYLAVVGQGSGAHLQGFFLGLKIGKTGTVGGLIDNVDQGGDTKMNAVVIKGATAYAGGHGKDADSVEAGLIRAYNLAPGTPSKPGGVIWNHGTSLGFPGGVVTTGLALGKKGVYLAGYGKSDTSDTPAKRNWVVKAWDLKGNDTWRRGAVKLNSGQFDQALDIAVGAKAVIAVGQVQDGPTGPLIAGVEAYTP